MPASGTSGRPEASGGGENRRVTLLGCPIDAVTMEEAVSRAADAVERGGSMRHMAVNAAKLVAAAGDPRLREIIAGSDLVTADGQAVVWAARLLGEPLPTRVAGIDLMWRLLAEAERHGWRTYLLGATDDVLEEAVGRLRARHPGLVLAGYRDGYFADSESAAVAEEIAASGASLLFVAMSSPRKEYFLEAHRGRLNVPFAMGVGGALDIVAGRRRRAPRALQRLGLEWLFRLAQEPRRLLRRYTVTNGRFIALVLRERLGRISSNAPVDGR